MYSVFLVMSVFCHKRSAQCCCLAWVTLLFIHGAGLRQLILRDLMGACLSRVSLLNCEVSMSTSLERGSDVYMMSEQNASRLRFLKSHDFTCRLMALGLAMLMLRGNDL